MKPSRAHLTTNSIGRKRADKWWIYGSTAKELYESISDLSRVLVCSRIGNAFAFAFLEKGIVYNEKIVVFPFQDYFFFCLIQSRAHEVWARCFSSTLKDDLQYTSSDCFETFPFPEHFESNPSLESSGQAYYEFRAALMVRNNEGLTKTYNRFHDPDERSPDILTLRDLHAAMDRAVLDAYGWTDLQPACAFLLDYEEDNDEGESGGGRRRKKPWRYRWPDDVRDEVLARLLELNRQRALQEGLRGDGGQSGGVARPRSRGRTPKPGGPPTLFGDDPRSG